MYFYKIIGTYEEYEDGKIMLIKEENKTLCIFNDWDEFENYIELNKYKFEGRNYIVSDYKL